MEGSGWAPGRGLGCLTAGIRAVCDLAGRFSAAAWLRPSPCPEWRAVDLAGHLRCVADNHHEYLDDAPVSRLARLLAAGVPADALERRIARRNAAELAALPDASGPEHIAAFARSAGAYAGRLEPMWDLPHHIDGGVTVTVAAFAGAAAAEWHVHAFDLAATLGESYRPHDPESVALGWRLGLPHRPLAGADPWLALLRASGREPTP